MNQILTMREKRASLWDAAKKYRDAHIANDGTMTAEDAAVYDRMVDDVDRMKKEIDRLERQESIEHEMNQPTSAPILNRPGADDREDEKKGRAADSYKKAFWKALRQFPDRCQGTGEGHPQCCPLPDRRGQGGRDHWRQHDQ